MSLATNVSNLATRVATEFKTIRATIGSLAALTTTDKSSIVAALNETKAIADSAGGGGWTAVDSTETVKGIVELATLAEVAAGTDTTRAVTAAGVRQERLAVKAEILDSSPGTLDTLNELAAALGDDPNYAASTATALGNRVRVDAVQAFTAPQQLQGRQNIDAASATDMGDPTTDFVATFNAGLV